MRHRFLKTKTLTVSNFQYTDVNDNSDQRHLKTIHKKKDLHQNFKIFRKLKRKVKVKVSSILIMEEEKEVSVEKEIKDRANKIAAHLSNDNNVISLRGDHRTFVLSSFLRKLGSDFCKSYS